MYAHHEWSSQPKDIGTLQIGGFLCSTKHSFKSKWKRDHLLRLQGHQLNEVAVNKDLSDDTKEVCL